MPRKPVSINKIAFSEILAKDLRNHHVHNCSRLQAKGCYVLMPYEATWA